MVQRVRRPTTKGDESNFCPGSHSHLGRPARRNLDLSPLTAGLLRARSPPDHHRTGNRKVGSLGNLMIGSLSGSAFWNRGRVFRRSRTSGGGPLPYGASPAPHERHWRLERPRLPCERSFQSSDAAPVSVGGRGPSSGQMPFVIARTPDFSVAGPRVFGDAVCWAPAQEIVALRERNGQESYSAAHGS